MEDVYCNCLFYELNLFNQFYVTKVNTVGIYSMSHLSGNMSTQPELRLPDDHDEDSWASGA